MQIYTLSDLHLEPGCSNDRVYQGLQKLCSFIRKNPNGGRDILFILLGDIINQGNTEAFHDAKECLEQLCNQLHDYNVHFEMVPGNHDRSNRDITAFDRFANRFNVPSFQATKAYAKQYAGINFIFADTTWGGNYDEPGHLDLTAIQQVMIPSIENVLVCHHAFTQFFSDNHDCVFNGDQLSFELRKKGIRFVIHGHTHKADICSSDETVTEFGCGSLFKSMADMPFGSNNQFAKIDCRDRQIVSIRRIIFTADGNGTAFDELYPQERSYTDPETIGKQQYAPTEKPHILRKVLPNESIASNTIARLFSDAQPLTLMDALIKNNHVLLLGDAGAGKSIELAELAHSAMKGFHFPFLYHLRDYVSGTIFELLPKTYRELPPERLLLLFDGYDELTEPYQTRFIKELNHYSRNEPMVKIAISSRSNFCKAELGNESRTFSGFYVYYMCELTTKEQTEYLQERGIIPSKFYNAVEQSGVIHLLGSPFYLRGLADIFSTDGLLPGKVKIMDRLIQLRFLKDDEKFLDQLAEREYQLYLLLQKLSFSMQLMHQHELVARTEYQRLFTEKERTLIQESGLLERNGNKWRFTHNNFREYLAALELRSYPLEKQLQFFQHDGIIYPNWLNTLGYLCGVEQTGQLLSWLSNNASDALVKLERDRVDQYTRNKVFQSLFSYYETRGLWFNSDLCSEKELVQFANSKDTLQYLLDKIIRPINRVSRRMALYMLADAPILYGLEEIVRNTLISCCKNTKPNDAYGCYLSMRALWRLQIQSDICTRKIVGLTRDSRAADIRRGLYEYILKSEKQDEYYDVFIEGISLVNRRHPYDEYRSADEAIMLAECLKQMSQPESVIAVLQALIDRRNTYFFERIDVIRVLFHTAASLYQAGRTTIFSNITDYFCLAAETGEETFLTECFEFFHKTHTEKQAVIDFHRQCFQRKNHFGMIISQDDGLTNAATTLFVEGTLPYEGFIEIMEFSNDTMYNKYRVIVLEQRKLELPERIRRPNYSEERILKEQEYFSILFDKHAAQQMLNELVSHATDTNVTIDDIQLLHLRHNTCAPLIFLQRALEQYVSGTEKAKDFFTIVDWDTFVICEAFHKMYQAGVKPSEMQSTTLKALLNKRINTSFIEAAIESFNKAQELAYSTYYTLQLSVLLDMPLSKDCLLLLTQLPNHYHTVGHDQGLYRYLIRHLGMDALKDRIIRNLEGKVVTDIVMTEHIQFCGTINCDAAVECALEICTVQGYSKHAKYESFKYLYNRKGAAYVETAVIPILDTELLCMIASNYKDISRDAMKRAMEARYLEEPNQNIQMYLITYGSRIALERYASEVQKTHRLPEKRTDYADGPTSAIHTISDPSMLPILGHLFEVTCLPDFQDAEFGGLQSGITDAFLHCSEIDPDASMLELLKHERISTTSGDNKAKYEYIKEAITKKQRLKMDVAWTIDQVEEYWNAMP